MVVIAQGDDVRIEKLELGPYGTNAYIIVCQQSGDSVLIDTPAEAEKIMAGLQGTHLRYILLTHNHMDHLGALAELHVRLMIPLAVHAADAGNLPAEAEMLLKDGDTISAGKIKLEVLHTPGHTPGSLCFKVGRYLISGDTLFPGGPGKTWSPADFRQIVETITGKLFPLPDDTPVYPGHGAVTVLKKEKDAFAVFSARQHDANLYGDVLWASS
ncbi:MAG: MBL fold metallo-hydrolase [Dehalococcoidales bacterium]|nr:MBL fold metallo-hydrolase [Dehalococcoidales bacterium]